MLCCVDLAVHVRSGLECEIDAASAAGPRKDPPIEHRLACTLEELYKGSTRKMKIQRTIQDASGQNMRVSEVLTVEVKPGWKSGTKITFPEKGECVDSGLACGPVHSFIIVEW